MEEEESADTSRTEEVKEQTEVPETRSETQSKEQTKAEPKKSKKFFGQDKKIEELQAKLDEEQKKSAEYLDQVRRTMADFENYRRRIDREKEEGRLFAALDIVKDLLNVADDLGRALENAKSDDPLAAGVKVVRDNLAKILENQGVKEIPTDGAFNTDFHEALTTVEGDEDGKIAMVAQKGYTMHDKVIRYAKVVVTRKREEPAAPASEEGPTESQ